MPIGKNESMKALSRQLYGKLGSPATLLGNNQSIPAKKQDWLSVLPILMYKESELNE
jgi:hypothetical protein